MVYLWTYDGEDSDEYLESYSKRMDLTGPSFLSDIKRYSLAHGEQCYFEDVKTYRVDYHSLTKEQLSYYLFWRDRFWAGKMLTTCEAYLWILANEIMVCRSEPVHTYLLLMQLWDERKVDLEDPSLFISFLRDYATLYNLPLPTETVFESNKNEMFVNNISSFSPYPFENSTFTDLCGGKDYSKTEPNIFNRTMNVVLRHIYRYMKDEGADLFAIYSDKYIEVKRVLFIDYPLIGKMEVAIDSPNVYHSLSFRKFMNDIARYVSSLIKGLRPNDRPNTLSPELISLIDDVFFGRTKDEPAFEPPNTVTSIRKVELLYVPRGVHDADPAPKKEIPSISLAHTIFDKNRAYTYGSRGMTEQNWAERSDEPAEYVPSEYYNVSYDTMNVNQRKYYTYWKTNIMNGVCLETDTGYIRMFAAELIMFSDDEERALELLRLMRYRYGSVSNNFLSETIKEYSMVHGIPDVGKMDSDVAMCVAYHYLSDEPMRDLPAGVIAELLDLDKESANELDDITVKAFNRSVRMIDEARKELGVPGCLTFFNAAAASYYVFIQLNRDYDIPEHRRTYSKLVLKRNSPLRGYLSQTLKLVSSYIRKAQGRKVKITVPKYHGERTLRIIEKCVLKEIEDAAKRIRNERKVVLDHDAISAADDDLKAVTDMISTETDEIDNDVHEQEKTPEIPETDDVWSAFISSLNDDMREYLKAALAGKKESSAVAKRMKMTVSKADDTVNTAAMDTVGDIVIEDGSVIEDYAEDVRSHLI